MANPFAGLFPWMTGAAGGQDDELRELMRYQSMVNMRQNLGNILMSTATGGRGGGGGRGRGGGPLDMMRMRALLDERTEKKRGRESAQAIRNRILGANPWKNPDTGEMVYQGAGGLIDQIADPQRREAITVAAMGDKPGSAAEMLLPPKAKTPSLQAYYNKETGREQKGYYDAVLKKWVDVGGMEAEDEPDPQSAIAQAQQDLNEGLITKEQYDQQVANIGGTFGPTQIDPNTGRGFQVGPKGKRHFDPAPQSGMDITVSPEGVTSIRTGVKRGGLTPPTRTMIQKELIKVAAGQQRLRSIQAKFKPEWQQWMPRWGAWVSAFKNKINLNLSPEDEKGLREFTTYRRTSLENINQHIKDITGAQMSFTEAERLRKAMPDPGEGIFDGDSPIEFEAKLKDVMKTLRMSAARLNYTRLHGLGGNENDYGGITTEQMPAIIDARGNELQEQLSAENPGMPIDQIKAVVDGQLRKEFGMEG